MGASSSKIEEDKALQLCRERKKFIRQALDGRCSLAAAHVSYVQSLKSTGIALRKFVEPEAPMESSLYTSNSATPEPLALTEKSLSHFSFSSPSISQRVDGTETFSPSPSPPPKSSRFQVSHMKFKGFYSRKVEEELPVPVIGTVTVTSSSTPQTLTPRATEKPESPPFETSSMPPETSPWDYFGLFNPVDNEFPFPERNASTQRYENVDDISHLRVEEGIPDLEDEDDKASFHEREEFQESDDEFDEPSVDTLVRSFENRTRVRDDNVSTALPTMPSTEYVASHSEFLNQQKNHTPDLSPVRATPSEIPPPREMKKTEVKEDFVENKVAPKDFLSSMKEIEYLFIKGYESGKEVPRMLEANKLHFRPIVHGKERGSSASRIFKSCFSCGEDHQYVPEEPAQTSKYLTWHRTTSSRSSSSRNPLGINSDGVEELTSDLFDNIGMISGSHASTLDRLYAWERKLYDEVKASEMVRREYDSKCKFLRQQESKGESSIKIDKTRAIVKDLHSRIIVAIYRIDSISKRIEELRDSELQPQLEELIEGLSRMWEVMSECHKLQFQIISVANRNVDIRISIHSESHRQITSHLENELSSLSSSFTKWIGAQKYYLKAINSWLFKCVSLPRNPSKRKRRLPDHDRLRYIGPPIYATCVVWLDKFEALPTKEVSDSIKNLASETARFLPRQEKNNNNGKTTTNRHYSMKTDNNDSEAAVGMLKDEEASKDFVSGFDRFRSSFEGFIGQLNSFAESSVAMYADVEKAICDAKNRYEQMSQRPPPQVVVRPETDLRI